MPIIKEKKTKQKFLFFLTVNGEQMLNTFLKSDFNYNRKDSNSLYYFLLYDIKIENILLYRTAIECVGDNFIHTN